MTKKHFAAIAEALKRCGEKASPRQNEITITSAQLFANICQELAFVLSNYNSKFDKRKFLEACGL